MDKVKKIWMKFVRELVNFGLRNSSLRTNLDASLEGALEEMSVLKFIFCKWSSLGTGPKDIYL